MLNHNLLNALIEAQALLSEVTEDGLAAFSSNAIAWKMSLEQTLEQLPKPLSQEDEQAIKQLLLQVDVITQQLTLLRHELQRQQQSFVKIHTAEQAYLSS
jgi:hypothetical protein